LGPACDPARGDGHGSENIPAAHAAGRFDLLAHSLYNLFRNADERAVCPGRCSWGVVSSSCAGSYSCDAALNACDYKNPGA